MTEDHPGPTEGPSDAPDPSAAARPAGDHAGRPDRAHRAGAAVLLPAGADATSAHAPAAAGVALADEATQPTTGGRRRTGLLVGALATVLVSWCAGIVATTALSGGGAQPAEVLPGDAYAYVRLDIDPSAARRSLPSASSASCRRSRTPSAATTRARSSGSSRRRTRATPCAAKFSYDSTSPRGSATAPVPPSARAARATSRRRDRVQVKDEDAARDTLTKLLACDTDGTGAELRMKDGYALITPKGTGDATVGPRPRLARRQRDVRRTTWARSASRGHVGLFDATNGIQGDLEARWVRHGLDLRPAGEGTLRRGPALRRRLRRAVGRLPRRRRTKAVKGDGAQLVNLPDNTARPMHVAAATSSSTPRGRR